MPLAPVSVLSTVIQLSALSASYSADVTMCWPQILTSILLGEASPHAVCLCSFPRLVPCCFAATSEHLPSYAGPYGGWVQVGVKVLSIISASQASRALAQQGLLHILVRLDAGQQMQRGCTNVAHLPTAAAATWQEY
jgi:hypothetical protein